MPNELARETSPYLLQHADNPVDWRAWNEATLDEARAAGKPLLVSIGYSACHWCHVMAHESFEDPETAALMNELFVNIKIDREERPDLDKIYQLLHQLTTGRPGGWPLTAFLTPDSHLPIFIGTYFPREPRFGMPTFKDVLARVAAYYREHANEVRAQGEAVASALSEIEPPRGEASALSKELLSGARAALAQSFDAEAGGFGDAPKFPNASNLEFLLGAWWRTASSEAPDLDALKMLAHTLTAMAEGGLYDHLGGGFFRYSVDRHWRIPHFEKMLYDNAALMALYSEAHAATGEPLYARVAGETADWMLAEMRDGEGAFYSTLDADAEGEEGKFYVWTRAEAEAVLGAALYRVAAPYFGFEAPANFERRAWHLMLAEPLETIATRLGLGVEEASAELASARAKLLEARGHRTRPMRDEKILGAWNGLAIRALAIAGRHLARRDLVAAAERAIDFVTTHLMRDGRLYAVAKDGQTRFAAYLDDYALLLDAALELLQCRWRAADLELARELAAALLTRFEDPAGGFYFTAHDHEQLIYRPKPFADEALPAGNAVAARALSTLGHLLGDTRALEAAAGTLEAAALLLERYPQAHGTMLGALERYLEPPELIVLRGSRAALEPWQRYLQAGYHRNRLVFAIPDDAPPLPGLLAELEPGDGTIAYLCRGTHCEPPTTSLEALIERLASA